MGNTTTSKRPRRMARQPKDEASMATEKGAAGNDAPAPQENEPGSRKPTKIDKVLSLLKSQGGATLDELVDATGWLPHTTRAALTGLKKKGHTIERTRVDGVSRYMIAEPAAQ